MNSFIRHLKDIVATISVDDDTKRFLAQDFAIIREYILEILKKHSLLKHLLLEPTFFGKRFNTSIVLDISQIFKLRSIFLRYPPFVQVNRDRKTKNTTLLGLYPQFFIGLGPLDGEAISKFVRATVDDGLKQNGCFIRGHRGDIYELDLCETQKQHIITIEASSENLSLLIDFRILMNLAPASRPDNPISFPLNNFKQTWLVTPHQCSNPKTFVIVTPFNENLMTSSQSTTMAYRLLVHIFAKMNLYNLKEEVLISTIYEVMYSFHKIGGGKAPTMQTVGYVLFMILRRMVEYFRKGNFPYYWDTRINMLRYYSSKNTELFVLRALENLSQRFHVMNANPILSYEEVQQFFGIEAKNEVFKVDHLGVFKLF